MSLHEFTTEFAESCPKTFRPSLSTIGGRIAIGVSPWASFAAGLLTVLAAAGCSAERQPDVGAESVSRENMSDAITEAAEPSAAGAEGLAAGAPVTLEPHAYQLWEGDWYEEGGPYLEDNIYFRLGIDNADGRGFRYQLEDRLVPHGPNAVWTEYQHALFDGPQRATDPATGHAFALSVDPADRHARVIHVTGGDAGQLAWSVEYLRTAEGRFVFQRSIYRAGFDCEQAATPVETTICGNELLALGDLEMNGLYRELSENGGPELERSLRAGQLGFLARRDTECQTDDGGADDACVARLYADRLVVLRRLKDPSLGDGPRFDADFARALLQRGADLRRNTVARLAMYPLEMKVGETAETVDWQNDESGVLYEQTYVDTKIVWTADVEIRYSDMLFVGAEGTVWAAAHMTPADSVQWSELQSESGIAAWQLELDAGRDFRTVLRESDEDQPDLVSDWLDRHPVPENAEFRGP